MHFRISSSGLFVSLKDDIPLSAADSLLPVLKAHVPDSTITLQARVGRTKAIGLIRNVIGLAEKMKLVNLLKKTKFSLIVDESTDRTVTKFLVIFVWYCSQKRKTSTEDYFSMRVVPDATAEGLKTLIIQEFTKVGIPIKNIIAIASDNASVMSGPRGGFAALIRQEILWLPFVGYICHSFALAATTACDLSLSSEVIKFANEVYTLISSSCKSFQ